MNTRAVDSSAITAQNALADPAPSKSPRLMSLDALRGFDMFWIVGADAVVRAWALHARWAPLRAFNIQMKHVAWEGLRAYDLIFPLFVFIVGVSLVFSLSKELAVGGRRAATRRIVLRSAILFCWGIIYNGGFTAHLHDVRLMGVLQRIALSYLFAALIFCCFGPRTMAIIAAGILLGYWFLLAFIPLPHEANVSFAEGHNWPNYFDARFLPGGKYDGDHDPEGPLSTPPAIATCILGVFAGMLLKSQRIRPYSKVGSLLAAGITALAIGYLWGHSFAGVPGLYCPIIKKIWTSSYVLAAAGYSAILLALFYLVIDLWKLQLWVKPFVWLGSNAITIYLLSEFVDFDALASRFIGGDLGRLIFRSYEKLALHVLALLLVMTVARFLYSRRIFLRV